MQLQFWRFSELTLHKLLGGWYSNAWRDEPATGSQARDLEHDIAKLIDQDKLQGRQWYFV